MVRLLILCVVGALGWSIYWAIGSGGATEGFEYWFEERRADGWVADYASLETTGFPNRFDTQITEVTLADPDTGLAWTAPFFQLFALSYKPHHIIAVWPHDQTLATPLAKYDIRSDDMRASLVTQPAPNLPLERLTLTAEGLSVLEDTADQPSHAKSLTLAAERKPAAPDSYRLGLKADGFAPALQWRVKIDPGNTLPETLDALSVDMSVEFDKPWDLTAIEDARPQPRAIDLRLAEARWGRLELQAAGQVTVDAAGTPTGEVTIKARNWRDILRLGVDSGALPQNLAKPIEDGLSLISQLAGNPKTLDIPLSLRAGRVFLGPVPLGPAPVLTLR